MELLANRILNDMPQRPEDKCEFYSTDSIAFFKAYDVFPGPAEFDKYEFVIPSSAFPVLYVDKREFYVEKNTLMPVNPGQSHGARSHYSVPCYIPIFIDKSLVNQVASQIFNISEAFFENGTYRISPHLINSINQFMYESKHKQLGYEFVLDSLTTQIIISILRQTDSNLPAYKLDNHYRDTNCVKRVMEFLRENYNKKYSFETVAQIANYSPYHFIKIFKAETGKTPHEYLIDVKIEKAIEQLGSKEGSITEVCFSCGFNSLNHFTGVFKKKTGLTPTEFKKSFFK